MMWTEKNIWIMSARGAFNLTSFFINLSSGFQAGPNCAYIVPTGSPAPRLFPGIAFAPGSNLDSLLKIDFQKVREWL